MSPMSTVRLMVFRFLDARSSLSTSSTCSVMLSRNGYTLMSNTHSASASVFVTVTSASYRLSPSNL